MDATERLKQAIKAQPEGVDIEAPAFPEELMRQAEEASKAFEAQAGEATKEMLIILEGNEDK